MRCDCTGAGYAILWLEVDGELVVAGDYVTPERQAALKAAGKDRSFAEASYGIRLPADGTGPVATAYRFDEEVFIKDVGSDAHMLKRGDLAVEYGIESLCFVPCEGGVLEFGTSKGDETATWTEMPNAPAMPRMEIRRAFENLGASYVMFWQKQGDEFAVIADYVTESRVKALKNRRGDSKTFCSESRAFRLPVDGDGPVATVSRTKQELYLDVKHEGAIMKRADLADEFGIAGIYFIPVKGGVLECGIPAEARLKGNALAAALKMRCDNSGAGYALYWTEIDGQFVKSGSYVTPARRVDLNAQGKSSSFEADCGKIKLPSSGDDPVVEVARTGKSVFVADASSLTLRGSIVEEYGIASVCFIPVEGGVMEFGTSHGPSTADWTEAPNVPDMPKSELQTAFETEGAVYAIFWQQRDNVFEVSADFVLPEWLRAVRNRRGDLETFTSTSKIYKLAADGDGYVATAARSGKSFITENPAEDARLRRRIFAAEFQISKIHFVPCKDGVLEYGMSQL